MKRDGHCTSLWQHEIPSFNSTDKKLPNETEVVIVGGGITGLTTALELQRSGKKCVVIEAQTIGFGTTGGTSAHLNKLMDTPYYKIKSDFGEVNAQMVATITQKAIKLIKDNVKDYSIECGFKTKA